MASLYVNIGRKIQDYLNIQQISVSDFAERCHVIPQVLNQIFQGRKALSVAEIQQIACVLNISTNELLGDLHHNFSPLDAMSSIIAKVENEHTQEKLHFLDYVMEKMLQIEVIAK